MSEPQSTETNEFERASQDSSGSFLGDFWFFLRENKKWWLIPLIIILLALGALLVLSGTVVAPFIYTLF